MQEKVGYRVGWHLNPDGTSVGTSQPTWAGPPSLGHCSPLGILFQQKPRVFSARTQHISRLSDMRSSGRRVISHILDNVKPHRIRSCGRHRPPILEFTFLMEADTCNLIPYSDTDVCQR